MLVLIDQLRAGDEILVPAGSTFHYLRLINTPKISKKLDWQGKEKYSSVKCSHRVETIEYKGYDGKPWFKNTPICTAEDHNEEKYFNLNGKTIWRIVESYQ